MLVVVGVVVIVIVGVVGVVALVLLEQGLPRNYEGSPSARISTRISRISKISIGFLLGFLGFLPGFIRILY